MDTLGFTLSSEALEKDLSLALSTNNFTRLHDADRQALFDGIPLFLARTGVRFEELALESSFEESPQLLIPALRLFVRADELRRQMVLQAVRLTVSIALLGTLDANFMFAGLTAELAAAMYEKVSVLDPDQVLVLETLINRRLQQPLTYPTVIELQQLVPSTINVSSVLDSLKQSRIVEEAGGGWNVTT